MIEDRVTEWALMVSLDQGLLKELKSIVLILSFIQQMAVVLVQHTVLHMAGDTDIKIEGESHFSESLYLDVSPKLLPRYYRI